MLTILSIMSKVADDRKYAAGAPLPRGGAAAHFGNGAGVDRPHRPGGVALAGYRRRGRHLASADLAPFQEPGRAGAGAYAADRWRIQGPPGRGIGAARTDDRGVDRPRV